MNCGEKRSINRSIQRYCKRISSVRAHNTWIQLAHSEAFSTNMVSHGRFRTDAQRKMLIGQLMCAYNPQRMMNASIRFGVRMDSTCVLLLYENGSLNINGTHSIDETIRAIHALREIVVLGGGGTFAEISDLHHITGMYILPSSETTAENGNSSSTTIPSTEVYGAADEMPHGKRSSRVFMGVRDPSSVAFMKSKARQAMTGGSYPTIQPST